MRLTSIAQICLTLGLCLASAQAFADLGVIVVNESALPFEFSPSNFENSQANFDNSIANFDNSSANFDNSEANFDNSSANFDNGIGGKNRLLDIGGSPPQYVGYYVAAKNGTNNFFSPKGQRLFYNPKKGRAIFGGQDGKFCGAIGEVNGALRLGLTPRCAKQLVLSQ